MRTGVTLNTSIVAGVLKMRLPLTSTGSFHHQSIKTRGQQCRCAELYWIRLLNNRTMLLILWMLLKLLKKNRMHGGESSPNCRHPSGISEGNFSYGVSFSKIKLPPLLEKTSVTSNFPGPPYE